MSDVARQWRSARDVSGDCWVQPVPGCWGMPRMSTRMPTVSPGVLLVVNMFSHGVFPVRGGVSVWTRGGWGRRGRIGGRWGRWVVVATSPSWAVLPVSSVLIVGLSSCSSPWAPATLVIGACGTVGTWSVSPDCPSTVCVGWAGRAAWSPNPATLLEWPWPNSDTMVSRAGGAVSSSWWLGTSPLWSVGRVRAVWPGTVGRWRGLTALPGVCRVIRSVGSCVGTGGGRLCAGSRSAPAYVGLQLYDVSTETVGQLGSCARDC